MTRPTRKPKHFAIRLASGQTAYTSATAYQWSIKTILSKMDALAASRVENVILINTVTMNSWTVTPEGRWL